MYYNFFKDVSHSFAWNMTVGNAECKNTKLSPSFEQDYILKLVKRNCSYIWFKVSLCECYVSELYLGSGSGLVIFMCLTI